MHKASNENRNFSRRTLLGGLGAGALVTAVAACESTESGGPTPSQTDGGPSKGREAPMLATKVEAGELPPVDERLPDEPLVVQPGDRIGVYGGTWNGAAGPNPGAGFTRFISYEYLTRWNPEYTEAIPNIARDFELSSDGSQVTFRLRPGMKWSDGEPFTAADLIFAYHDVLLDTDVIGTVPAGFMSGGKPATLEQVDEYTVTFVSSPANGLLPQYLATPNTSSVGPHQFTALPRHYLEKFHQKYNADVDQLVKDEGRPSWNELFLAKADLWANPELPRLHAWVPTTALGEETRIVFERNPYYWKVDPEGSQLPYLDQVDWELVTDTEVILLKASNGELDLEIHNIDEPQNKPILAQSRERGNYDFFTQTPTHSAKNVIAFNLTHKDPVKREIFQNRDFRVGLSHAINRQEIIEAVLQRQGEPYQVAPRPESELFDEEMAKQYTEYDPDAANSFLDRAGYVDRNGSGIRLGPDGNPISFTVECNANQTAWIDSLNLVQQHWREVGVDMQIKTEAPPLFFDRTAAGEHDVAMWEGSGGGGLEIILEPDWYFPFRNPDYAPLWVQWFTSNGESGEEPPEEVRRQMELYNSNVRPATNDEERLDAMREILQTTKEFFYHVGISLTPDNFGIVRNDFHNVPSQMPASWSYPTPGPTNTEQYFTSKED